MRPILKKLMVGLAFTVLAGTAFSVPAAGAPSDNFDARIKKERSELEALKRRIEKQEKTIFMAGKKESSVLKTMSGLEDRLKLKERELKIYQWNKQVNKQKIGKLTAGIRDTQKLLDRQKSILAKRLRTIYKEGSMFPIKVLFAADSFNDLLQRVKYMQLVAEFDSALFQKYETRLQQLSEEKITLLKARNKLTLLEERALQKQNEIQKEKNNKSAFLTKLKKGKQLSIQLRKELVDASGKLNNLIVKFQEKQVLGAEMDIGDKKGVLQWPVQGKILNKFGKRRDKQYNTIIVYNGVNIKVAKGTPVRAIFGGKVLYAASLEGYGNMIILGHGNDYHTLYGHLDEIVTKVGRTVRGNQIVGRSGDTGSLFGETLYFEIRHKGKPIEPTRWFKVAKR